jgi:hypothetical protein
MTNPPDRHSTRSILKACTLPLAVMGGFFIGGFVGALFGVAGIGAAVGVGIGLGMGVGLTAIYAVKFFESDH